MFFELSVIAVLAVASITDIRRKEVPIWEVLACMAISAIRAAGLFIQGNANAELILSVLPGLAVLVLSYVTRQGIGYGDGLMLVSLGPALGLGRLGMGLLVAFFSCSVISGILLFTKKAARSTRIPFIPFITIGMGVSLFAPV
ncbi:MAG: prepilin peptidase [Butyrivibrio sp.]|nr:prepilin peptidase [Butyrivibrio sp.]